MTKRIFRAIATVALSVVLAMLVLIMGVLYTYFSQMQQTQLRREVNLAAAGIAQSGEAFFSTLTAGEVRITWISEDGTVLYDTQKDPGQMENHLEREEVRVALSRGYGESVRYSETLMQRLLYAAQRLPDGSVVRLSYAQSSVFRLVLGMVPPVLAVVLLALILSLVLASRLSGKVVEPLNHLDLDHPLANENCDELSPLLRRIETQQRQLRDQAKTLRRRQEEFDTITASMSEGLVLLNPQGTVLSISGAAERILGLEPGCEGQDILMLNRTVTLQELIRDALDGRHGRQILTMEGREYQMTSSPVCHEETVSGIVLLIFDVTEAKNAEQMRREFTANVSHELRTPLQTISGCAELLCSGLVKEEDTTRFQSQIYAESRRMIRLVEDIINLSRLDEGAQDMERREVDLWVLAQEAVNVLGDMARRAQVELHLEGGTAVLWGIPQLLSGILVNLGDNAIKYNRPGGSVDISVLEREETVVLKVKDTGIGIPPEHQSRIFERFYRVDKSRSKAVGGTGLGLSIVKHAAMVHGAEVELESAVGEGTCVTIEFPKKMNG